MREKSGAGIEKGGATAWVCVHTVLGGREEAKEKNPTINH
jgi:hypothetical protein